MLLKRPSGLTSETNLRLPLFKIYYYCKELSSFFCQSMTTTQSFF